MFDDTIDSLNETTEELATQIILEAEGSNMTFANWLEDHLVSHMLVSKKSGMDEPVRLVEKGVMEVKIEDVPSGAFVIHFDKGDQGDCSAV